MEISSVSKSSPLKEIRSDRNNSEENPYKSKKKDLNAYNVEISKEANEIAQKMKEKTKKDEDSFDNSMTSDDMGSEVLKYHSVNSQNKI